MPEPENIETTATAEVEVPAIEAPTTEAVPTMEAAKDVETVQAEGEVATEEVTEEAAPEAAPEPVVFDAENDDVATVTEKAQKVLDQYELPEEVQNAFNALTAKANSTPAAELAVYGETEAVTAALERHNLLFSVTETEKGEFRPNTDKFVAELDTIDSDTLATLDWLFYDISNTPSKMYPRISRFEENLVNYFGNVGEPVGDVMERARQVKEFMQQGLPQGDMPSFIPANLRQAYFSLESASRADIEALESTDEYGDPLYTDADKARKLGELTKIQRGIDAERNEVQRLAYEKQVERETFNQKVVDTQNIAFAGVRDAFAADLKKEVKFSDNPKVQALLCSQQVTMLQQAFLPDADGEFARKALAEGGLNFDFPMAQSRIKAIEKASVELTLIQSQVDENGVQMNQVELNKATKRFADAVRAFQEFGAGIIRQQKQIVTAGTKETVDKAVEKRKIELKTRPAVKAASAGVKQTKTAGDKPPATIAPFSKEWDEWYADKQMAAQGGK